MRMSRRSTPAPAPKPILVARLGPLSLEFDGADTCGAVDKVEDIDEDVIENVELEGSIKDVITSIIAGCAVIEGTEFVVCCWRLVVVAATTSVDASKAEDIEVRVA